MGCPKDPKASARPIYASGVLGSANNINLDQRTICGMPQS